MSTTTLLPGVRLHPNGASFQVRVRGFKPRSGFATPDEANEYATELRRRKRQGVLVAPELETLSMTTLAAVAREHLDRLASVGGRHGRAYTPDGLAEARKAARPWTGEPIPDRLVKGETISAPPATDEHGTPFAAMPLAALNVRQVERYLERRSAQTPRAAVGEYQSLRAILRLAARRGERFEHGLLALEPVRRRPRPKTHVPTLDEFRFLAARAPEHSRRLLLLGASLGGRIGELLAAEDAWIDLDEAMITMPEWATKERREKVLDLLPEECDLIREQRLVRSPNTVVGFEGSLLLFPRPGGTPWRYHSSFWNRVIVPTRTKAARAWREQHGTTADAPTPSTTSSRRTCGAVPRPSCASSGSRRSSQRRGSGTRTPVTCSSPSTPRRGARTCVRS